jgi:hypothetical protein
MTVPSEPCQQSLIPVDILPQVEVQYEAKVFGYTTYQFPLTTWPVAYEDVGGPMGYRVVQDPECDMPPANKLVPDPSVRLK